MSSYTVKTKYNVEVGWGYTEEVTLYAKHNISSDVVSFFDNEGKHMFSVGDCIDNNLIDAINRLYSPGIHYSEKTVDFEFEYPFGQKELFGLAYRADYDLKVHNITYLDEERGEKITPHVIEPSLGVDRALLAVLLSAYKEDGDRVYLKLSPSIAPTICAVSPLLKNKPELVDYAKGVFTALKEEFGKVAWDDNGNIGKRYRRQDEIGTPFCIVIDFDTLEDDTVTVRDRDTGEQERIAVSEINSYLKEKLN